MDLTVQERTRSDIFQTLLVELWSFIKTHDCNQPEHILTSKHMFHGLMYFLHKNIPQNGSILYAIYQFNLYQLFSFISYVRDIHNEFGHRTLTYAFLSICYNYEPLFCETFIKHMLTIQNNVFSTGSWRDICGLCNYLKDTNLDHPLISFCIQLMNKTLFDDWTHFKKQGTIKTNVAKWVPREKSKPNKWLYERLVFHWAQNYTCYLPNIEHPSYTSAIFKCKTKYRQMVSQLTRLCEPIEHKLCAKKLGEINPDKITCCAFFKYWNVLFNQTSNYDERCSKFQNFCCVLYCKHYIASLAYKPFYNFKIRFPNITFPEHLDTYVKRGVELMLYKMEHNTSLINSKMAMEIEMLNHKWQQLFGNWSNGHSLKPNALAVIHVECSSFRDPQLHKAIGRACFLAKKSNIQRILFSCHVPLWINVEKCDTFMNMIEKFVSYSQHELWVNTSLENSLAMLGSLHPFALYILSPNGQCSLYGEELQYEHLSSILQNKRYAIFSL